MSSTTTISLTQSEPGPATLRRLAESRAFAWIVSGVVHGLLFLLFYQVVLREEMATTREIIPEARLAPMPAANVQEPTTPLSLSRQPSATPPETIAQTASLWADLPVSTVTLDAPTAPPPANDKPTLGAALPVINVPIAPPSTFFGQAGNAYKVVYVVDVSASLMIYTDDIVAQMRESIRDLIPTQRFHIVLARPGRVEELSVAGQRRLVPATTRFKQAASAFLDTIERIPQPGQADPIEAMRRAFAVQPELIYFLSDGDYRRISETLHASLKQMNPTGEIKISVIGFDPAPTASEELRRIADEHGGHYRVVAPK